MNGKLRKGFTLIELLVVVLIVAVLIWLLIPAVSRMREVARITDFNNNFGVLIVPVDILTEEEKQIVQPLVDKKLTELANFYLTALDEANNSSHSSDLVVINEKLRLLRQSDSEMLKDVHDEESDNDLLGEFFHAQYLAIYFGFKVKENPEAYRLSPETLDKE